MEKQLFEDLVSGMNEMVAIENGTFQPKPENVHRHAIPNVKTLRNNFGMKQAEFAEVMGTSVDLVSSWEQNRRIPTGIALKLLCLLEREPELINTLRSI
ncbi:putative transcriptional regulator [Candidatus Regiella insecticola 5.15]|uniref:Putative transcriptional regulator n=1 Tax=Candidatus Regiella insecticola 5.15 TaxID=1005043 RepID=G2H0B2_9ENTR|nr:NadS family protein [Candidatus Regiella insecticola]EGY28568.1 putative transcriptional regulator [Candidatus Regiella insecticola 5.15]